MRFFISLLFIGFFFVVVNGEYNLVVRKIFLVNKIIGYFLGKNINCIKF